MRMLDLRPRRSAQALGPQRTPVPISLKSSSSGECTMTKIDHKAHEYSADGEDTVSAFSTSPYPGRSSNTVPPTNLGGWIIMSNSSGKRIMTTIRHCSLGELTARMTPTEQARRKSWYVSASRGRIAFAKAGTPKENSRTSRLSFTSISVSEKGNLTCCMAVSVLDWFATAPYHLHRSAQRQLQ